jgi:hypothetical protein
MPSKEAPQWQAAAASGSVYAGTLDRSDNSTTYPNLRPQRPPIGFDPLKFPIIARHWLGFERGGRR